ncbi:phage tail length tape measure family protein [Roseibacterium beibuensis]|uniref:Bacteriophage tail tape measure N-terminal domain-containing protein n=1 Tax=[Roseibacterium] beibuensis TaxID=1193142 RepID=A0ABP9L9W3_9RHOB|nr:phage tail length tape measure family protein [Roseibacterium beibuensis]MCS6624339.1 phage tail length tape measure family protein [Roseibacterium beibuensis]
MLEALRFSISANNATGPVLRQVLGDLRDVRGMLAGVGDYAVRAGRRMRNIGAGMSAAVTAPLALMGRQAVQLYDTQLRAERQVQQAIASTGGAAGLAAQDLFDLASGLQAVSTFGDEDILQNVTAPLLTFTNVAGDSFERAQAAILDMSALLGTDLQSATMQVGRALNDPVAGLSALSRAGVQFTEEQEAMIRNFAEQNDLAAAQAIILGELETQFGGQAEVLRDLPLGQVTALQNAIGDLKEELGEQIVPFITPLVGRVERAVEWFGTLSDTTRRNIVIFGGLAAATGPILMGLGLMVMSIGAIVPAVAALVPAIGAFIVAAAPLVGTIALIGGLAYLAHEIYENWGGLHEWWSGLWSRVGEVFDGAWASIGEAIGANDPDTLLGKVWSGVGGLFRLWLVDLPQAVGSVFALIADMVAGTYTPGQVIGIVWDGLVGWFEERLGLVPGAFGLMWGKVRAAVSGWATEMAEVGRNVVQGLLDGIQEQAQQSPFLTQRVMGNIIAAARAEFGIQSPSRVFREIGDYVMQGLGLGIAQGTPDAVAAMEAAVDAVGDAGDTMTDRLSGMRSIFTSILGSILSGTATLADAIIAQLNRIGSEAINSGIGLLGDVLFGGTSTGSGGGLLGSLLGGLLGGGGVQPFAKGGVPDGPMLFPMSSGTGLMGEAGLEGILPLARGPSGRLGVEMVAASGAAAAPAQPAAPQTVRLVVEAEEGPMFRPMIRAESATVAVELIGENNDRQAEAARRA